MKTQVLNSKEVSNIMKRMAYQVYEQNFKEKELVIVGIVDRGMELALMLKAELEEISSFKLQLLKLELDKPNPDEAAILISPGDVKFTGKNVILVDDVLNTGKTLVYATLPFLKSKVSKLQVAVLVDRNHKNFPVSADFIGISMSTTLQEHISVEMNRKKEISVYLM